jgi:hypothetical protein
MNGHGFVANKAGSSKASKINAVITLCLSMVSPEKRPPRAACQAVVRHGMGFKLKRP